MAVGQKIEWSFTHQKVGDVFLGCLMAVFIFGQWLWQVVSCMVPSAVVDNILVNRISKALNKCKYPSSYGGIKRRHVFICELFVSYCDQACSATQMFYRHFLSVFLPKACVSGPPGSTPVLRQDEEVQTTWPGVPERSAQTGALSVQQGK